MTRLRETLARLANHEVPDAREAARLLGVAFRPTRENRFWRTLEATDPPPPWARVELRLEKDGARGLLALEVAEDGSLDGEDLVDEDWGRPELAVNPEIPPEGVVHHVYHVGPATVSLGYTARSDVLRAVTIGWEG